MKAREAAWRALNQILGDKQITADVAIDNVFTKRKASADERPFTNQLVLGTLRQLSWLDNAISPYLKAGLNNTPLKTLNILRLGAYQILFIDVVPVHAAVSETVRLARSVLSAKATGFTNAVLRRVAERKEKFIFNGAIKPSDLDQSDWIALRYSFPLWMVQRFIYAWGIEETENFCAASNEEPQITLRVNTLKTSIVQLRKDLKANGFDVIENVINLPDALNLQGSKSLTKTKAFSDGHFYIQDSASQLVGHILEPEPGELICDLCAAPGGKTTHIAQLANDKATIYALDISNSRCDLIKDNCRRLDLQSVEVILKTKATLEMLKTKKINRVLVDAPCSGLGTIRRHPDIKWHRKKNDIKRLTKTQFDILNEAASLISPGGFIVYSTCTVLPEENQNVIRSFLNSNPEFELDDLISSKICQKLSLNKDTTLTPGFLQLLPHQHKTDGFFIARLKRKLN